MWLAIQVEQHLIENRRGAPRARVIEDGDHGPGVAIAVAAKAGNGPYSIEGAGLDMGLAVHGRGFQAFAHGAVLAGNWHGADELGSVGAFPGGLEHLRHFTCADALGTGQPGAVLHYQMRCGNAFFRQPLTYYTLRGLGIVTVGIVAKLRAQAQEQLLGHGVVAVLVDVANDLGQIRREGSSQQLGAFWHAGLEVLALDTAAQFFPDGAYGPCGVGRVIKQRQIGL